MLKIFLILTWRFTWFSTFQHDLLLLYIYL
nr:MAG TPA_asm: hypothetical protein [Caudoviricetes sp.]